MPRGRPPQNLTPEEKIQKKLEQIDEEWRDSVAAMTPEQIKNVITEVSQNEAENQQSKEDDQDLESKHLAYQDASVGYKEATQMNKLKVRFALRVLSDKGAI